jgi:hypothetical protein
MARVFLLEYNQVSILIVLICLADPAVDGYQCPDYSILAIIYCNTDTVMQHEKISVK